MIKRIFMLTVIGFILPQLVLAGENFETVKIIIEDKPSIIFNYAPYIISLIVLVVFIFLAYKYKNFFRLTKIKIFVFIIILILSNLPFIGTTKIEKYCESISLHYVGAKPINSCVYQSEYRPFFWWPWLVYKGDDSLSYGGFVGENSFKFVVSHNISPLSNTAHDAFDGHKPIEIFGFIINLFYFYALSCAVIWLKGKVKNLTGRKI